MEARELPRGTVTLLFTDIEGSTRMLQELGREAYVRALTAHRRLLREAFTAHGGVEVEMQGDSFHFAFPYARDAVAAAVAGQRALLAHEWESEPISVRIGLHTGEPIQAESLYAGLDVHRAARVMSAGHGGQVLVSEQTAELVEGELPPGIGLLDLGEHRLKDLSAPQRLYQALADPLPVELPPLKTLSGRPTNLPVQPTRLIGRATELADVTGRLRNGETRLLTLTGAGGSGKTRLALQAAAELADDFSDGVFFVSLAPVHDPALVVPSIAHAVRLRDQSGASLEATLTDFLAARRALLVLDNFERVVEAAPAVSRLLSGAPGLVVLATSREPLRLSGETRYPVESLSEEAALTLFAERALAADPHFKPTENNRGRIRSICARLDGLPLAIELAAARVSVLSLEALERRLDLTILTGGARDAEERQRTLRSTIAWSYDLLEAKEQRFFEELSVFVDGCRLDAVEIVCGPESAAGVDLFDSLCSLVSKSLLRRRDDPDGEPRFWMLQTIRQYAEERLAVRGDGPAVLEQHARWCCSLAQVASEGLHGKEQLTWMLRLGAEYENLRAALAWTLEHDGDAALELVGDLGEFWDLRGEIREGAGWIAKALAMYRNGEPRALARALLAEGTIAFTEGDFRRSLNRCLEAAETARGLGDEPLLARALSEGAWSAWVGFEDAELTSSLCEESLSFATKHDDRWCIASAMHCKAIATLDTAESRRLLTSLLRLYDELGDSFYRSRAIGNVGWSLLNEGDSTAAAGYFAQSIALAQEVDDIVGVSNARTDLAVCQFLAGEVVEAGSTLTRALHDIRRTRSQRLAIEALGLAAAIARAHGDEPAAWQLAGAVRGLSDLLEFVPSEVEKQLLAFSSRPAVAAEAAFFAAGGSLDFDAAVDRALAALASGASGPALEPSSVAPQHALRTP